MQKDPRKPKNFPEFTHFASVPFIRQQHRQTVGFFQDRILQIFQQHKLDHTLKRANTDLMHITLSMLTLNLQEYRQKTVEVISSIEKQVTQTLKGVSFRLGDIKYFKKYDRKNKKDFVSLFYFDIQRDENTQKLDKVTDLLIRQMIKAQVIDSSQLKSMHIRYDHKKGMYINDAYHMTLFRIQGLSEDIQFQQAYSRVQQIKKQKDIDLTFTCDFVDVSTRGNFDQTKFYLPLARVQIADKFQNKIQ